MIENKISDYLANNTSMPLHQCREHAQSIAALYGWTAIEEGLPEKVQDYLVWYGDGFREQYRIVQAFFNGESWQDSKYGTRLKGVTHYQAIQPPGE